MSAKGGDRYALGIGNWDLGGISIPPKSLTRILPRRQPPAIKENDSVSTHLRKKTADKRTGFSGHRFSVVSCLLS